MPDSARMMLLSDRYELGAVIGTGSSAVVHRAWDRESSASVAVKILTAGPEVHDPRRHDREIDALTRVRHPGLAALRDHGVDDGVRYLVLDLVDGPTLAEHVLLSGPLTPDATRRLGARVAAALAAVHAAGIVHRDVKPANVLIDLDGAPRLTDFGIAHALDATALTRSGAVVGTVAYLAPEQVRGRAVGVAADVYALGLVLLEAATGRREYPGTAAESAAARLHRSPAVPRDLPNPLARTIRAMTASDPARRPTAAAVADLLSGSPATTAIPRWRAVPHGRWAVATGGLLVAAAATGVVLIGGPDPGVPVAEPLPPAIVALVPDPYVPDPTPIADASAVTGRALTSVTADPPEVRETQTPDTAERAEEERPGRDWGDGPKAERPDRDGPGERRGGRGGGRR